MQPGNLLQILEKVSSVHPLVKCDQDQVLSIPLSAVLKGFLPLTLLVFQRFICLISFLWLSLDQAILVSLILGILNYTISSRSETGSGFIGGSPSTKWQSELKEALAPFLKYEPPWWCLDNHSTTCWPLVLFNHTPKKVFRQTLTASDGSPIGLDWYIPEKPIVGVVLTAPGLNGTSKGGYIVDQMERLGDAGYVTAVIHGRGAGLTSIHSVESAFHLGRSSDLLVFVEAIEQLLPEKLPIFIVGYSAGGIRAVKFSSVYGDKLKGRVAGIVSFGGTVRNLETPRFRSSLVYQQVIIYAYAAQMYSKLSALGDLNADEVNLDQIFKTRSFETFREFDTRVTSVLHKMSVEEYEQEVFPYHDDRWRDISVPVLFVNAVDDPVLHVDDSVVPEMAFGNSNISFLVTEKGGHIGWPTGFCKRTHGYGWMSRVALTFMSKCY